MSSNVLILQQKKQSGFTLIELMITAAIIVTISAILVIRYSSFNSSVLLKNQAYEIALTLREAQVFSVSSRGTGGTFRDEYGVYFDKASNNRQIILYANPENLAGYRVGSSVVVETVTFDSRFKIVSLCKEIANSASGCQEVDTAVSIQFKRPNFDPVFYNSSNAVIDGVREFQIGIEPEAGAVSRTVNVGEAGQIYVSEVQTSS